MAHSMLLSRRVLESSSLLAKLLEVYGPDAVTFTVNGRQLGASRPLSALLKVLAITVVNQQCERVKLEAYPARLGEFRLAASGPFSSGDLQLDQSLGQLLEDAEEIENLIASSEQFVHDPSLEPTPEEMARVKLRIDVGIKWDAALPGEDVIEVSRNDRPILREAYGACKTLGRPGRRPRIAVRIGGGRYSVPYTLPGALASVFDEFIELAVSKQAASVRVCEQRETGELTA